MIKYCPICEGPIKDKDRVFVGTVSTYHEIPSRVAFAIDKPSEYTYIAHAKCEDLE